MVDNLAYRIASFAAIALLSSCSGPVGPTDEQVARDVTSFLQEKCEPLGASATVRPIVITGVRVERRNLGENRAEILTIAQGELESHAVYQGYVFSDYCPVGLDRKSEVNVAYAFRDGAWHFEGGVPAAGGARASLNTASSQGTTR
ncbi:MAG TPA: hypothetical protein VLN59_16080 [Burkholderiales bacterium]|nr:hypothetical protein [Burkholderiales bacterium]